MAESVWQISLQSSLDALAPSQNQEVESRKSSRDHRVKDRLEFEWMAEETKFIQEDPNAEPQLGFHFVTESGIGRPGGPIRNVIRSQARRSKQQRVAPAASINNEELPIRQRKRVAKIQNIQASRGLESTGRELAYPKPTRGPGNVALDPFGAVGTNLSDRVQSLLNHYDSVFRHSYCPVEPREQWVPFCLSDPAALYATLFCTALHRTCLNGKLFSPDITYYQAKTIRLINSRLVNEPERMASDSSICAVACLAHLENISANTTGAKIHIDGLENLVKSRGGLSSLAGSPLTIRLVSWVDSAGSIILQERPRFERDPQCVTARMEDYPYSPLEIRYRLKLFNLSGLQHLSDETMEAYHKLCYLTSLKDSASRSPEPKAEMASYGDSVESVERQIVRLVQAKDAQTIPASQSAIFSVFGNAALIHIYLFLRDMPRGLPMFQLLSTRIREGLERGGIEKFRLQYPEMTLWVFIMGGLGGIGTLNRGWFARQLAEACLSLGIVGGNEIAFTLSEFLWSELYLSPVTVGFWNEVAIAQGVENGYEVRRLSDHVSTAIFNAPDLELE